MKGRLVLSFSPLWAYWVSESVALDLRPRPLLYHTAELHQWVVSNTPQTILRITDGAKMRSLGEKINSATDF